MGALIGRAGRGRGHELQEKSGHGEDFCARAGRRLLALRRRAGRGPGDRWARTRRPAAPAGQPAILVTVDGFSERTGNIRVALYGSNPRTLPRARPDAAQDQPAGDPRPGRCGSASRCPTPAATRSRSATTSTATAARAGATAAASRATRDISLTSLRPRYDNVAINVGAGVLGVNVVLNYRFGLSIRPVRS